MLTKPGFDKKLLEEKKETESCSVQPGEPRSSLGQKEFYLFVSILILTMVSLFVSGATWSKVDLLEKQILGDRTGGGQLQAAVPVPTNNPVKTAPQPTLSPEKVEKATADDHVRGDRKADVQLIVYSDLECPFSKRFHAVTKQVFDQYKDQIAIVYRHFPLDAIHPKTRKEAEATECAAKLAGNVSFWRLTDKIYETTTSNNGLDLTSLPDLASQVGLNKKDFQSCLESGQMAKTVEAQFQSGVKVGVGGTPGSVLINVKTNKAKFIPGALSYEQIKPMIEEYLSI